VAEQNDRHLTTEQLSALLDQQLSPEEQATYDAHLQTCQQCQRALADLRQTVALVRALPQPALPRSFVLPAGTTLAPERPMRQLRTATPIPQRRQRLWQYYAQRSVRAVSTLAAVLGLIFILSGILPPLSHNGTAGGAVMAPASAPSSASSQKHSPGTTGSSGATPPVSGAPTCDRTRTGSCPPSGVGTQAARVGPATPIPSPSPTTTQHQEQSTGQTQTAPPILDLSTAGARQEAGVILLVLGILGVVFTRRKRRTRY